MTTAEREEADEECRRLESESRPGSGDLSVQDTRSPRHHHPVTRQLLLLSAVHFHVRLKDFLNKMFFGRLFQNSRTLVVRAVPGRL